LVIGVVLAGIGKFRRLTAALIKSLYSMNYIWSRWSM